jgi:cyclase
MSYQRRTSLFLVLVLVTAVSLRAQSPVQHEPRAQQPTTSQPAKDQPEKLGRLPEVRTIHVAENLYMLANAGGNIGLLVGDDGPLMIDSAVPEMGEKVEGAIKKITPTPIHLLINTHWHFDHVGGNERFHKTPTQIVAHENVRKKMSTDQHIDHIDRQAPASAPAALPTITYPDTMTLYANGEEVRIIHPEPAHTDGDSIIQFRKANVVQTGDIYFANQYPFIDVRAGGSLDGMIKAVDRALDLADDKTKIIPGHGPLSTKADLQAYRDMLATARDRIRALVKEGKSRTEAIAAQPLRDLNEKWEGQAFPADMWVGIVYDGMVKK